MSWFNLQRLHKQATTTWAAPTVSRAELLALVDAVEAAHRVAAMEQDYSSHEEVINDEGAPCPPCVKWRDAMEDLDAALAVFSFEEPA